MIRQADSLTEVPRRDGYRFVIEAVMLLARAVTGFIWPSVGPLLPLMMAEYAISRGTVGWVISITPLVMTAASVPAGILAARIGAKKTFAIGSLFQAAGLFVLLFKDFPSLLVMRGLFAVGTAICIPLAAGITASWFEANEAPFIHGVNQGSNSLGNAASYLLTIPIATALTWRAPIAIYSAIALVIGIIWAVFGRESRKAGTITGAVSPGPGATGQAMSIGQVLRQRAALLLAFSLSGAFCLFTAVTSWLPTYYHEVFGMPLAKASSITALFMVSGFFACIIGGILPGRLGLRRPILIGAGITSGLSALGCILTDNPFIIYPSVVIMGVAGSIYMPSVFTIPVELPGMTPRTGALILSLALGVGNFGGFIGPLIVGYLTDLTGSYLPGFLICCVLSLSLLIGGLLLPETGPRGRKNHL